MTAQCRIEQIKVVGADLQRQVERIVHEGNVQRIVIKHEGRVVAEFPLTVGVIGTAIAPMLAAVGALAAALTHCTIEVERVGLDDDPRALNERANQLIANREVDEAILGKLITPHR